MFNLLKQAGIPLAYQQKLSETEFLAKNCRMIPLEVVVRRYAVGSYLERNPHLWCEGPEPLRFHRLVVELFLKTSQGIIRDYNGINKGKVSVDDPLIRNHVFEPWQLMHPKKPAWSEGADLDIRLDQGAFLHPLYNNSLEEIEAIARRVFLVLEGAWAQLDCRLIDFKIEFGMTDKHELVVADVVDNDSWRLRTSGWQELSKQLFRENASNKLISEKYALVAQLSREFSVPSQAIVFWRGSVGDPLPTLESIPGVDIVSVAVSGHKCPEMVLTDLEQLLARYPGGGAIIALVGMSNGLGPILSARTSWPVIAVPLTARERPHDVWSSLEMPSSVPLMTVLNPKNAILAALNILAQKNPVAYMQRQYAIEALIA